MVPGEGPSGTSSQATFQLGGAQGPRQGRPYRPRDAAGSPQAPQGAPLPPHLLSVPLTQKGGSCPVHSSSGSGGWGSGCGRGSRATRGSEAPRRKERAESPWSLPAPPRGWFGSRQGCPQPRTRSSFKAGGEKALGPDQLYKAAVSPPGWRTDTRGSSVSWARSFTPWGPTWTCPQPYPILPEGRR